MKSVLALSILLAGVTAPQDSPTFKPTVGQKQSLALDAKMTVAGLEATIKANIATEVKKADDSVVAIVGKWSDLAIEAGGNPYPAEVSDSDIELTKEFQPKKIGGGIEGLDSAGWFIATHFIPPTKAVAPGTKYTVEVKEVADKVPAYTYDGEYVGKEDVNGKATFKFKGAIKMKGEGLSSNLVANVREDGTITKVVADFKSLEIPAVGQRADGKITLTAK